MIKLKQLEMNYIKSCLNYTGGKHKLLKQLVPYFPESIETFVDLFCGGANVAINVNTRGSIYCIDKQKQVISLFNTLKHLNMEEVFSTIYEIINKFELSDTSAFGYDFYGCESGKGLAEYNKEKYKELRDFYNSNYKENDSYFDLIFFVLTVYGFNNQIRYNKSGHYNIPVGKRDFNDKIKLNLKSFIEVIKDSDINFQCKDFRNLDLNLKQGDFLYADPPYLISTATYNEQSGWTEVEELALLKLLDELDSKGVKFALSNVLEHKGEENILLKNWSEKYKINYLDYNYKNSNYQIKEKSAKTIEVLITNYKN